jgi:parallel beta-helix repeat protein
VLLKFLYLEQITFRIRRKVELLRKTVSGIMLSLLVISTLTLAFNFQPVKASGGTIYIRADGSIDPPDAPITTFDNVTYTFTGNILDEIAVERDNIVVDGAAFDSKGISISGRNNVTIKNTNIRDFTYGIYLDESSNYNNISGNNITANYNYGIRLDYSSNNSVSGNNITGNNYYGIGLYYSSNNSVSGNTFVNDGLVVSDSYGNVVTDNLVNGKPLVYLEEVSDYAVEDAGQVILVKCNNVTVENLNLSNTAIGVQLWETNNTTISGNNITNNMCGIALSSSSNNTISENNITNNWKGISLSYASANCIIENNIARNGWGIELWVCSNNRIIGNNITDTDTGWIPVWYGWSGIDFYGSWDNIILENNIAFNRRGIYLEWSANNSLYHNSFVDNAVQTGIYGSSSINVWDDGYPSGGNFWSDYAGVDLQSGPYQNETGSDGMGDTSYNQDNYPLMKPYPWSSHDIGITGIAASKTVVGQGFNLDINITIFNYGDNTETFNVTVYCNETTITLPNEENHTTVTLASGNSTTITFTWNTTGFAKGNYTIKAYAWPVPGENDISDNTLVDGWIIVSIPGDIDGSFRVDIGDLALLGNAWFSTPGSPNWNPNADINDSGRVDVGDLALLGGNWFQTA